MTYSRTAGLICADAVRLSFPAVRYRLRDDGSRDNVVISCPTAGGKTEAAFLPSLSIVENYANDHRDDDFVYMLYVAPLKALINDQYRRMREMAAYSSIPVYIWHGDAPQAQKKQQKPAGEQAEAPAQPAPAKPQQKVKKNVLPDADQI